LLDSQESGQDSKRGLVREGMNLYRQVKGTGDQETQQKVKPSCSLVSNNALWIEITL